MALFSSPEFQMFSRAISRPMGWVRRFSKTGGSSRGLVRILSSTVAEMMSV